MYICDSSNCSYNYNIMAIAGNENYASSKLKRHVRKHEHPSHPQTKTSSSTSPGHNTTPDLGRTPLIYAESNKNRVGWLMPDESIPE